MLEVFLTKPNTGNTCKSMGETVPSQFPNPFPTQKGMEKLQINIPTFEYLSKPNTPQVLEASPSLEE